MKTLTHTLVALALLISGASAQYYKAAASAKGVMRFPLMQTSTQGGNGLQYGEYTDDGDGTDGSPADPATFTTSGWTYSDPNWRGPGTFPRLDRLFWHPSTGKSAVLRYTATYDVGVVRVILSVTRTSTGTQSIALWHNGTKVSGYTNLAASPTPTSISADITLSNGDTVDFELNALGTYANDGFNIRKTVYGEVLIK